MSEEKTMSLNLYITWSDLHLSESQRVLEAGPVIPVNAFTERRVVILTVQVGMTTWIAVPPGTYVRHCT